MSLAAPRSADARPAPRTGPGGAAVWRLGLWWTACVAASIALAWGMALWTRSTDIVPLWPTAGIVVGALFALPRARALGVVLAAAVGNAMFDLVVQHRPLEAATITAVGSVLEPIVVFAVLRRVGVRVLELRSFPELAWFAGLGAAAAPFVTSIVTFGGYELHHGRPLFGEAVLTWWMSDALAILVLAPLTAAVLAGRARWPRGRAGESWAALGATTGFAFLLFGPFSDALPTFLRFPYWMSAVFLWVALRAGRWGAMLGTAVLAVIAVGGTSRGYGPFAAAARTDVGRVALAQVFVALGFVLTVGASLLVERLEMVVEALRSRRRALAVSSADLRREREHLHAVLDAMAEAVVVCDAAGTPVLRNAAAIALEPHLPTCVGGGARALRPEDGAPFPADELPACRALRGVVTDRVRIAGASADGGRVRQLEANARPLRAPDGAVRGAVVVFTDVTSVAAAEVERQRLVDDLQRTVAEVRVLRGILPICGYCKRIRDEQGDWTRLETFVTERSQASFSHGVCPDCLQRVLTTPGGRPAGSS